MLTFFKLKCFKFVNSLKIEILYEQPFQDEKNWINEVYASVKQNCVVFFLKYVSRNQKSEKMLIFSSGDHRRKQITRGGAPEFASEFYEKLFSRSIIITYAIEFFNLRRKIFFHSESRFRAVQ